ncbi:hypothetical protein CDL15_Pgr025019 [Punica granatum]|uniref:Uncharacterized protein n=1 Tax=Punica granatum TaxID=22663 RepID=A0A218W9T6_PUNGR|nr:hypothetical protein CDL15_Pgr025019 [Punica granatum]
MSSAFCTPKHGSAGGSGVAPEELPPTLKSELWGFPREQLLSLPLTCVLWFRKLRTLDSDSKIKIDRH